MLQGIVERISQIIESSVMERPAWGAGQQALEAAGIAANSAGVVTSDTPKRAFTRALVEAIGWHRHWDRPPLGPL